MSTSPSSPSTSNQSPIGSLLFSSNGQQGFTELSGSSSSRIPLSSAKLLRDDIRETLEFADFPNSPFCTSFLTTLLTIQDDATLCDVCNAALYSAEKGAALSTFLPFDKAETAPLSNKTGDSEDKNSDYKLVNTSNSNSDDDNENRGFFQPNGYCKLDDNEDEWDVHFDDDNDTIEEVDNTFTIVPPPPRPETSDKSVEDKPDSACDMTTHTLPQEALAKLQSENNKIIDSVELLVKNLELDLLLCVEADESAVLSNNIITTMFCTLNDEVEKMENDTNAKENVYAGANKIFSKYTGKPLTDIREELANDLRDVLYDELVMVRAAKAASGTAKVPHACSASSYSAATAGSDSSIPFPDDDNIEH